MSTITVGQGQPPPVMSRWTPISCLISSGDMNSVVAPRLSAQAKPSRAACKDEIRTWIEHLVLNGDNVYWF